MTSVCDLVFQPMTPERSRMLAKSLRKRLEDMRSKVDRLAVERCVMSPDEVEQVAQEVREMTRLADEIGRGPVAHPAARQIKALGERAVQALAVVLAAVDAQMEARMLDQDGEIERALTSAADLVAAARRTLTMRQSS